MASVKTYTLKILIALELEMFKFIARYPHKRRRLLLRFRHCNFLMKDLNRFIYGFQILRYTLNFSLWGYVMIYLIRPVKIEHLEAGNWIYYSPPFITLLCDFRLSTRAGMPQAKFRSFAECRGNILITWILQS